MPKALIPNHMFFDNDDEPYTVLRTIRVGLEMQGFTVEEDPECIFTHGAHGNQEAHAAATCAELDKAGKLLTPHELELLTLYRSFTPSERDDMLQIFRFRKVEREYYAAAIKYLGGGSISMADDVPRVMIAGSEPSAVLKQIILPNKSFTLDLSGMNLNGVATETDRLRASALEAFNNVVGELFSKGWEHHSFGTSGALRLCKLVDGELHYAEVISRITRDGDMLTAIVESHRIDPPSV
ncbi:hypothetical protein R4R92_004483 [Citrobacter freundii]|uniref:hypothetical protein n=1 Tax=Citrobacter freundii TaxID=546 RepID=UPI0028DACE79|nr:hypothetical protein [Citrobacter freundii]ELR9593952.1 hypothetical protein [Citrobacter freundii]HEH9868176.1 hypothetical protein [Citrobacter freundii]